MKNLLFCWIIWQLCAVQLKAQQSENALIPSFEKHSFFSAAKTTVADPAEDDYNVRYVKLDLALNNLNTSISGSATTVARVVAPTLQSYVFELTDQLTIDSVFIDGVMQSATGAGPVRTVSLSSPLNQGDIFTVQVFYHGAPTGGTGFFSVGINNAASPSWGNDVTYTLSEPYHAMDWWPCKQSLTDKIDSSDIWLTVDTSLKAGSNGLLQNITPIGANLNRYEWHNGYPIDYYLLSASVARYVDYSYYVQLPNSTDSVLVQNYVYDNPQTLPFFKNKIDSVGLMIKFLSRLYGKYPFWKEKYGHCMAPINGGMEHQTMTTLGNFQTTTSVHELGHQWFGDHVTCGTWKDIWLNEGFAAYTEYLFVTQFYSPADGFNYMASVHNNVMTAPGGSVYVDDTTDENRIFSSRLTYDKGSSIVHSLRFMVNDDTAFFAMLRLYQQHFAWKTATTEQFKHLADTVTGLNLDTFFNQWIYGEGFPTYSAAWNQVDSQVYVVLDQTTSKPSSVPFFYSPVEIKLKSQQGDTVIRVNNNQPGQLFSFTTSKTVTGIEIDPNDWLLNQLGPITHDASLSAQEINKNIVHIYPNPASDGWQIAGLSSGSELQLFDISGRMVWLAHAGQEHIKIPAARLPSGSYLLKLTDRGRSFSFNLIRQ